MKRSKEGEKCNQNPCEEGLFCENGVCIKEDPGK